MTTPPTTVMRNFHLSRNGEGNFSAMCRRCFMSKTTRTREARETWCESHDKRHTP